MEIVTPIIETKRLVLSGFGEDDKDDIFVVTSNPSVSRYTAWNTHKSIEDTLCYIEWAKVKANPELGKVFYCRAIRLKSDMIFIGAIDFTQKSERVGQIDYMLSEEYWNKGIMTEAAKSVVTWAFTTIPGLDEIQCYGLSENAGSMRVMENIRLSFRRKTMRKLEKFGDTKQEVSYYYATRNAWLEND